MNVRFPFRIYLRKWGNKILFPSRLKLLKKSGVAADVSAYRELLRKAAHWAHRLVLGAGLSPPQKVQCFPLLCACSIAQIFPSTILSHPQQFSSCFQPICCSYHMINAFFFVSVRVCIHVYMCPYIHTNTKCDTSLCIYLYVFMHVQSLPVSSTYPCRVCVWVYARPPALWPLCSEPRDCPEPYSL